MMDYRLHLLRMATEDRLRETRERASLSRGTSRVFQLDDRRPARKEHGH